jgi:peptide/nickel transport system substrate-binding protein
MVKRIFVLVAVLLIISLAVVACSSSQASPTTSSAPVKTTSTTTTVAQPTSAAVSSLPPTTIAQTSATSAAISPKPVVTSTPGGQQYGGILRQVTMGSPLILGDPTLASDSNSIGAEVPAIETLVNTDNAGQFHAVLATDWTIAPDGKSITLQLRKGVKFQDGTDFNAQAVKWNLDRYYEAYKTSSPTNQWNGIDVIDDYTVKLNLKSFMNTLINGLDGSAGMMISPTAFKKNGADWAKTNSCGTGSYMLKSFSRDVKTEYTRFNDYWGGKPYLDGMQLLPIADATTAQLFFQSGGADVAGISSDIIVNDLVKKGYLLERRPGAMTILIPDSKHATSPFANLKVRQALMYAIDRPGICNTLGYGLWEPAYQPAAAYQFGHIDNIPYAYDVAKAKQLMKEAGFPNGFKTSIILSSSFNKDPLVVVQAQLAAIGITVDLKMVEFASWNDYVNKGWDNALLYGLQGATFTNYVSHLTQYFSSTAVRYPVMARPAGLDDLINKALATPDYKTEKDLCQQAVKMIVDDATAIPLYIPPASFVLQTNVRDTHFDSLAGAGFRWGVTTSWLSK